jgi:ABC-type Fe3+ transport system substrate-binding protein
MAVVHNTSFFATLIAHNGEVATEAWLRGVKANLAHTVNNEYPVHAKVAPSDIVQSWGSLKPDPLPLENIAKYRKKASELVDKVNFDAGPSS